MYNPFNIPHMQSEAEYNMYFILGDRTKSIDDWKYNKVQRHTRIIEGADV